MWRLFDEPFLSTLLFIANVLPRSSIYGWCFPTNIVFHQQFSCVFLVPWAFFNWHYFSLLMFLGDFIYFLSESFFVWKPSPLAVNDFFCSPTVVVTSGALLLPTTMILYFLLFFALQQSLCPLEHFYSLQRWFSTFCFLAAVVSFGRFLISRSHCLIDLFFPF